MFRCPIPCPGRAARHFFRSRDQRATRAIFDTRDGESRTFTWTNFAGPMLRLNLKMFDSFVPSAAPVPEFSREFGSEGPSTTLGLISSDPSNIPLDERFVSEKPLHRTNDPTIENKIHPTFSSGAPDNLLLYFGRDASRKNQSLPITRACASPLLTFLALFLAREPIAWLAKLPNQLPPACFHRDRTKKASHIGAKENRIQVAYFAASREPRC